MHIGFGKTGTSSLQAYLTEHPILNGIERTYEYSAIQRDGHIVGGSELSNLKADNGSDYVVSHPDLGQISQLTNAPWTLPCSNKAVPIFSQEDWARRGASFLKDDTLAKLELKAEVVVYVRPQVEWVNSGWWQWWAWEPEFERPQDVINKWSANFCRWRAQLKWWQENPCVEKLTVRLHTTDIINDFCGVLETVPNVDTSVYRNNTSLTPFEAKVLRILRGNIRRAEKNQVDSLVRQILPSSGPTPWAIDRECAQMVVEGCRADNFLLLDMLNDEQKEVMRADERWWSAEPYREREVFDLNEQKFSESELEDIVQRLFAHLLENPSAG